MIDTRIWICPKLCGCELKMKADWVKDAEIVAGRRLSYQHPKPFSITLIEVVNTCAEHDHLRTSQIASDPYNGSPGYIKLPIENPTEAEKLYIGLYRYNGQKWKPDTCDCKIYQCYDELEKKMTTVEHAKHTSRCMAHLSDTSHTLAINDNKLKNNIHKILLEDSELADASLDDSGNVVREFKKNVKFSWKFDKSRNIQVALGGVTSEKQQAVTLAVRNLSEGGTTQGLV